MDVKICDVGICKNVTNGIRTKHLKNGLAETEFWWKEIENNKIKRWCNWLKWPIHLFSSSRPSWNHKYLFLLRRTIIWLNQITSIYPLNVFIQEFLFFSNKKSGPIDKRKLAALKYKKGMGDDAWGSFVRFQTSVLTLIVVNTYLLNWRHRMLVFHSLK